MNLAAKDIRHNFGRFALTVAGLGLLLTVVMGMSGIYRGIIQDATLLVERIDADLWVVQRGTRGPLAEVSRLPANLADRVAAVAGVADARRFVFHAVQREHDGRPLRIAALGLDWPRDDGAWLPLVAGRPLAAAHFEMVADRSLGLPLGAVLRLGKDDYRVVGIAAGMIDSGGNGIAAFTVPDALRVQLDLPGEALRLERAARRHRAERADPARSQPLLLDRVDNAADAIPALPPPAVSAIVVRVRPDADPAAVAATIAGWPDVTVHTRADQRTLMLSGPVEKAKQQIGLFRVLLTLIGAVVMALILYTLTLDKLPAIALLKLIGAPNRTIAWMILQQALWLGALGFGTAYALGQKLFPRFPRRVIVVPEDLASLAVAVLAVSVASTALGMWRALRVSPNEALS